jgi:hypothetical protein
MQGRFLGQTVQIMTSTNLKEADYLKSWAIFFVLAFIGGTVAGRLIGGVAVGILGAAGASARTISVLAGGLVFLISLPISYFCFRFAVTKFLLPKVTAPEPNVVPLKAAA